MKLLTFLGFVALIAVIAFMASRGYVLTGLALLVVPAAYLLARGASPVVNACNNAGAHDRALVGRVAETALAAPYLVVSKGTTAGRHVIPCASTGALPIGFATDEAAAGEPVTVDMGYGSTRLAVASAAIAADVLVYTEAGGKLSSTGGAGKYCMGRSVTAATGADKIFSIVPFPPVLQS